MKTNHIYNEDCRETLGRMGDDAVDCVITSPPYNMNLRIRNGKYCSRQIVKEFSSKYEGFDDNLPIDDFYELHSGILKELLRVSPLVFYNISIVTGSKRAFFKMIGEFHEQLKDIVVWDKNHGQPAMAEGVLNRRTELVLVFDRDNAISRQFKQAQFYRGTLDDIWHIGRPKKVAKSHGAIFPETLVSTVIQNFTKEGDVVYDPFMGTGTSAVVSKGMGRKYIGSEISESYLNIANDRLKVTQTKLM